jgi:hypothetical protein
MENKKRVYVMEDGYLVPKQEPKQECKDCNTSLEDCTCIEDTIDMKEETLEEALSEHIKDIKYPTLIQCAEFGAKWQKENSNINALEFEIKALKSLIQDMDATIKSKYSEEEVLDLLQNFANDLSDNVINIKFWFEKFKNK